MIASIARAFFVFSLAMTGATACSSSRRLGSPEDLIGEDHHDRFLQDADNYDNGQPACGFQTPSVENRLEAAKTVHELKTGGRMLQAMENVIIPVYIWHTYSPGSAPSQILTKEMIEANHMAALHYAYRNTPFVFDLKDIQIVESAEFGHCERLNPTEYAMKKALRAPGKNSLNLYICDSALSDSRAWSSYPVQADIDPLYDGVVVRNFALVSKSKQGNAIQNVVHEVGHWLGLLHTFEGGCSPSVWNTLDGVHTSGDGVDDTPAHAGPTDSVFPGVDTCWAFTPPLDTCMINNGADAGYDPVRNYMNYLPSGCLKDNGEFTPGQVTRMLAQSLTFRVDSLCRPNEVTCTNSSQCCAGLTCIGGSDMKMKCK